MFSGAGRFFRGKEKEEKERKIKKNRERSERNTNRAVDHRKEEAFRHLQLFPTPQHPLSPLVGKILNPLGFKKNGVKKKKKKEQDTEENKKNTQTSGFSMNETV